MASRLSEDPEVRVLLLEAGYDDQDWPDTQVPAASMGLWSSKIVWDDYTVPQTNACLGMKDNVSLCVI